MFFSSVKLQVVFVLVSGVYRTGIRAVLTGITFRSQIGHVETNAGPRVLDADMAVINGFTNNHSAVQ
jgi:hypothetical protein